MPALRTRRCVQNEMYPTDVVARFRPYKSFVAGATQVLYGAFIELFLSAYSRGKIGRTNYLLQVQQIIRTCFFSPRFRGIGEQLVLSILLGEMADLTEVCVTRTTAGTKIEVCNPGLLQPYLYSGHIWFAIGGRRAYVGDVVFDQKALTTTI